MFDFDSMKALVALLAVTLVFDKPIRDPVDPSRELRIKSERRLLFSYRVRGLL